MDPNAPVMMTLAALAYASPSFIRGHLAAGPVGGVAWDLAWIADDVASPANFAFLVRDPARNLYALAIRGTYPDPFSPAYWADGKQDSPFGTMQPWPYADEPAARVAAGSWAGFQGVLALGGRGAVLADVLTALRGDALYVAGHSLGGTLAPIVALWASTVNPTPATVYAFAGMTPGNAAFAGLFGAGTALAGRVWRYNNSLDTVAYGWDRVTATADFYQPHPRGGLGVEAMLYASALALLPYDYTAVGEEIVLTGTLAPPAVRWELLAYLIENLHQHLPSTYLSLLGAAPLPFTIGFGPVVDEGGGDGDALRRTPAFLPGGAAAG